MKNSKLLRTVFAEVANIPAAVAHIPALVVAPNHPGSRTVLTPVAGTAALAFAAVHAPVLLAVALPLYAAGRVMQGMNRDYPPLAHRVFKVDRHF